MMRSRHGRWRGGAALAAALVGLILLSQIAGGEGTTFLAVSDNTTSLYNGTLLYQESVQGAASTPISVFDGLFLTDDVSGHLTGATVVVTIATGFDNSADGVLRDQLKFPASSNVTISSAFSGSGTTGSMTLAVGLYTDATYVRVRAEGTRPRGGRGGRPGRGR